MIRKHISRVLAAAGFHVRAVDGGRAAVSAYHTARAALVILDVVMPEMDGLETLQALRAVSQEVRIIGISGIEPRFPSMYLKLLQKLGAQAILEKPFTDEALILTVHRVLREPGHFRAPAGLARPIE